MSTQIYCRLLVVKKAGFHLVNRSSILLDSTIFFCKRSCVKGPRNRVVEFANLEFTSSYHR